MTDVSKKDQLFQLIQANPFISQQELAGQLQLSRSAVAGYIAGLIRERRILGRAYVLPGENPVVCIGGANMDRKVRTLGALQMGTSNPVSQHESLGGVARNIAENLARLGAPVSLLTALGDDAAAQAMLAQAESVGMDMRGSLQLAGSASGSYTAVLDDLGEMVLALSHMQLCDELTPQFLASRQPQRAAAAMTIADLNLPEASIRLLLQDAARDAVPLVLVAVSQPKMARLPADLHGLRLLILNQGELEARVGKTLENEEQIAEACRVVQQQGAQDLIVTFGGDGVLYTSPNTSPLGVQRLAAPKVAVVDVTGAGDAFSAAVCWSLSREPGDLALACRHGLTLAAMTIQSAATVCTDLTPASLAELLA
ncbi:carbohydrate kinase [Undibacterium terreum]|uniref:Carbohydrate kinase n=1 Tax=Undibacterium terreum TaxID=1224302 RepID=A0A916XMD0_9BURK|nr:carbohydrate kinase [Undibacterium terreum]GGC82311.1 carbohydrate kinase [Undibacterium terreum]